MNNPTEREIKQDCAVTSIYNNIQTGQEIWNLYVSDVHFDSVFCNRDLFKSHLDEAVKRNANVCIFGDYFDSMQGRYDKRRSYPLLREEYKRDDYFDFVTEDAIRWLLPYAHLFDIMSDGNHEMSVLKHSGTNLMDRLVTGLRTKGENCHAVHGGYGGWIRYMFSQGAELRKHTQSSIKLKYYHGSGGEAPVSRGAIQTNRQAVYLPDANLVINGHSHHAYYIPITRERIGNKGKLYFDICHFIRIPGYMQSYGDGSDGWEAERGGVPKPIGAFWVKFTLSNHNINIQVIADIVGPTAISL